MTSISSGEWILPKGNVDPGSTPAQTAEIEAREEAGVAGSVCSTPVAVYDYKKGSTHLRVQVFPLLVARPGIRSALERFAEYLLQE